MNVINASVMVVVVGWAGALSISDLASRRLPNTLTVGGAVLVLTGALGCGRGLPALLGAAGLGALYLLVHLADSRGLGGGDVKLALALGGLTGALGLPVWSLAALGAPLLTAASGVAVLVLRLGGRGSATTLPHGVSMCVASLAAAGLGVL